MFSLMKAAVFPTHPYRHWRKNRDSNSDATLLTRQLVFKTRAGTQDLSAYSSNVGCVTLPVQQLEQAPNLPLPSVGRAFCVGKDLQSLI